MSGHWWRAYDEAIDDPKLIGLNNQQHRFWFNILCVCSSFDGRLPDVHTLSIKLRMQQRKVVRLINELCLAGLLDRVSDCLVPHNWDGRQYKSDVSTERVKRFRNAQRNVSETPPDTDTDTDTDTDKKNISIKSNWPKDFRELFWNAYPRKVGKGSAIRKLESIRASGEIEFSQILTAIRQIQATEERFIPHPTTWLNQGRYLDGGPAADDPPIDHDAIATKHGYAWNGEKYIKQAAE